MSAWGSSAATSAGINGDFVEKADRDIKMSF